MVDEMFPDGFSGVCLSSVFSLLAMFITTWLSFFFAYNRGGVVFVSLVHNGWGGEVDYSVEYRTQMYRTRYAY